MESQAAYAHALLRKGYGYQNAARISGMAESDLRQICGARPVKPVEPIKITPRRPRQVASAPRVITPMDGTLDVLAGVANKYGFTVADLLGPSRVQILAAARQEAYAEVRKRRHTMSLPAIGRLFGGRDHTTILHGIRTHNARLAWGEILIVLGSGVVSMKAAA